MRTRHYYTGPDGALIPAREPRSEPARRSREEPVTPPSLTGTEFRALRTRCVFVSVVAALAAGGADVRPLDAWVLPTAWVGVTLGIAYVRGQLILGRRRWRRLVETGNRR